MGQTYLCVLCIVILLPSWVSHLRPRKRQVMSPTAHLPSGHPSTPLSTTAAAILLLFSLLAMTGSSLVYLSVPTVSMVCRLCTFTNTLAQLLNQTTCLSLFALAVSCLASLLASLILLVFLPGPLQGVGEKRSKLRFFYLARLYLQIPQVGGFLFLGFTPSCRPAAGGPTPLLLIKLGFLPGPVCGVREKKASRALSFLALLLNLSLTLSFYHSDSRCEMHP